MKQMAFFSLLLVTAKCVTIATAWTYAITERPVFTTAAMATTATPTTAPPSTPATTAVPTTPPSIGGAVYVRWGRTVCYGDAVELYRGYAGGSRFDDIGGGSQALCLASNPEWGTYVDGVQTNSSQLYGVEYHLDASTGSPFSLRNNMDVSLYDQDVPCIVCHAVGRQSHLLVPGRKSCPSGWVLEYWGYLVSSMSLHSDNNKASYECLDEAPESIIGGGANTNGKLWYPVQARCGALPCLPYVDGRELTCAVCTK